MRTHPFPRSARPSRAASVLALLAALAVVLLAVVWPAAAAAQSRIVAVGDIHGDADALIGILQQAGIIDANRHWIAGNTSLVQTGDLLDRGLKDREVMELLMSLEQQAPQAGGRVVVLLGNHEVMNLMGDLRYTVNYTPFADAQSEERRKAAYQAYVDWRTQRAAAQQQPAPTFTPAMEQKWMETRLRGFVERANAFGPNGQYGAWLRTRPAVVQIDSVIFLHGGIAPAFASLNVETINAQIKKEVALFDRCKQDMIERKLILPFFTLDEMTAAAQEELNAQTAKPKLTEQEKQHVKVLQDFLSHRTWLSTNPDGPLWFRGFAEWTDAEGAPQIAALRTSFKKARFVVGHTTQRDGRIHARFGNTVFLIDTGMLSSYYRGGRASALEIHNGTFTAIYPDQRTVLRDPLTTGVLTGDQPLQLTELDSRSETALALSMDAQQADSAQVTTSQPTPKVWWDPDGQPLPFQTDEQIMAFLKTATVVSMKDIGEGVTRPKKALLEKDGIRMHAIFRDVSIEKDKIDLGGKTQLFFRDDAIFECAAYALGRLLGLNNVPPVVKRSVQGKDGTLQIWVEHAMTEGNRRKRRIAPLNTQRWDQEWQVIEVFDNLIYNDDRNAGNIIIDQNWNVWMIDHTRAFRLHTELRDLSRITQCERNLWRHLQTFDEAAVKQQLSPYLRPFEIEALLKRRSKLVEYIQKLIQKRGEQAVLFRWE